MIKFEKPVAEIEKFELLDVITTSATECGEDICWEDGCVYSCDSEVA